LVTAILNSCGMSNEDDAFKYAFVKSMLVCMAANSASQLVPGRSKFHVDGSYFDFFKDVMTVLGEDARRFFRAYADMTKGFLIDLQREYREGPLSQEPEDIARYEEVMLKWDYIILVAEDRGLTRIPYMVHDSAECCSQKTSVERVHLAKCKETMFANGAYRANLVDNPVIAKTKGSSHIDGPVVAGPAGRMPDGF